MWLVLLEQETDWSWRLLPVWDSSPGYLSSLCLGVISCGFFCGGRDLLCTVFDKELFPGLAEEDSKPAQNVSAKHHWLKLVLPLPVHCFSLCLMEFSARVGKRELLEAQLALGVL